MARDIVVTGRGLDERAGDAAASIVTLDRDAIAGDAANRLESVLGDVAGLQQFRRSDSRSANPTSQGLSLRGIGGNASSRALLILDGVPQADPFGGWVAFPAYAPGRLDRIRVTRGGGSGYFGAGALAGTIELESAGPRDDAPVTGGIAYGSRNSIDADAAATLHRGAGFATLSAAYARGDGFVPIVAERRGPADRAAPYEQASGALRGVIAVAPQTELQANVSGFTDSRERGTAFTANRSEGADASVRLIGRGAWGWSALGYVQTRAFASSVAGIDAMRTIATQTLDQYNTPATGLGARLEVAPPIGAGIDLRLGADWRRVSGRTQERFSYVAAMPTRLRVAGGTTRTYGVFADGSIGRGPLTFTLGGRIDWWGIADGRLDEHVIATGAALTATRFADRDGSEATGRAGAAWRVVRGVTLRGSAYRGWRLPTLNELYRPFRAGADATSANAALAPEHLTGVDGGVTLTPAVGLMLSATAFWNRLNDSIANVGAGVGPGMFPGVGFVAAGGAYRVRRNLDAIRSAGVEVDAAWQSGPYRARLSWSHVDPRVSAHGAAAALDGLRPAQTPRDQVAGSVGLTLAWIDATATARYVSGQFEDDQNSRILAPATTLDARIAVSIGRRISIEARGENVFDTQVDAAISAAGVIERATPRTLWIGLRYGG